MSARWPLRARRCASWVEENYERAVTVSNAEGVYVVPKHAIRWVRVVGRDDGATSAIGFRP